MLAEVTARELGRLSLEDALQLRFLYAEKGPTKFERAALRWLGRYVTEGKAVSLLKAQLAVAAAAGNLDWCRRQKMQHKMQLEVSCFVNGRSALNPAHSRVHRAERGREAARSLEADCPSLHLPPRLPPATASSPWSALAARRG
jgi:hypothetical protein